MPRPRLAVIAHRNDRTAVEPKARLFERLSNSSIGYVGKRAMQEITMLSQLEYQLGTLCPMAVSRLQASGIGPAGGSRLRRLWEPSPHFTDHILGVSELYVKLREMEVAKDIEELLLQAEPACWRYWTGIGGERLVLKPDAYVRFGKGDYEHSYFIELDRASQSSSVIRRKGEVYISYFHGGLEQERRGVFPQVLFVVPDTERLGQIVGALGKLDAEEWRLFGVRATSEAFSDIGRNASI